MVGEGQGAPTADADVTLLLLALLLAAPPRPAATTPPPHPEVVGAAGEHVVAPGESLVELALAYDVGFNEMAAANPLLDPLVPTPGAAAVVPSSWILPRASASGALVVNLSEMRHYFIPSGPVAPVTFPIGGPAEPDATPLGTLTVVEKIVAPTWFPPPSIREEDPELPASVPPGPDNPLGSHALRLSSRTIMIHGTTRPFGIGRSVSHGCLRLYPEDIARLFEVVPVGTPVAIVREPVKVGLRDGRVLVEVHEDAVAGLDPLDEAVRLLSERLLLHLVDLEALARTAQAGTGLPVDVTAGGG
jgi:L,D-transpeptidase ErfK/SrfK